VRAARPAASGEQLGRRATGAITTTGGTSGDGGNVSVTTSSGTLSVGAIGTGGGTAQANRA
jgi:hypothetical protein